MNQTNLNSNNVFLDAVQTRQLSNFFSDCYLSMQTKGMLCPRSLKEYLGMDVSPEVLNSGNVHQIIQYLWLKCVNPQTLPNYSQEMMEKLLFPALFSRQIIIRRPSESDFDRVSKKLYMVFPLIFKSVVANYGIAGKDMGMVIEAANVDGSKSKVYGAIHYTQRKHSFHIRSLKVHGKRERLKYGSLLLNAAIIDALKANASYIKLESSPNGLPFYVSFGFVPRHIENNSEKLKVWNTLNLEKKVALCVEKYGHDLRLDMQNLKCAWQNLLKALTFNQQFPPQMMDFS